MQIKIKQIVVGSLDKKRKPTKNLNNTFINDPINRNTIATNTCAFAA